MAPKTKGLLFVLAAALLWSSGGIGIKSIPDSPLKVTFYRSLFAAIVLLLAFRPKPRWNVPFIIAIVSYASCLTTFVTATKLTTAANAIFLQYSGVIWVLIFSPIFLKEPLRRRDIISIVIALFGMALFFAGKLAAGGGAGNTIALLSGVFFAALIISLRKGHESAESAVTYGNLLASLAILPAIHNDLPLSSRSLLVLILLGVFQIGAAYALFVRGLRYVTATQASITGMIEPVANPIWVFLFLGERPSGYAILGAGIVLIAVLLSTVKETPAAEAVAAPD
ncbi:MAG TPA: DMT family transporter [Thermoanaerobaculia bacterium]|nr:DMT family transporter [Thermoanaerobaculia bacterium]